MNALSDLLAEVKFRERMRGYDYTEVDNYVKTVNRAATQSKERIAELESRLAQLDSRPGQDGDPTEVRETLLRTLVLAQRTADTAVSEARSEAKSITDSAKERAAKTVAEAETAANERLRSAEERAARMLAESEENGQVIIAEAKRTAAVELASEREQAQEELHHLETTKEALEAVVAEIQARLDGERDMLRSLSISFQSFVEKFEPVTDLEEPAGEPAVSLEESVDEPKADEGDESAVAPGAADGELAEEAETAEDAAGPPEPSEDQEAQVDASGDEADQEHEGALREALAPDDAEPDTVPELPVVDWDEEAESDRLHRIDAAEHEHAAPDAVRLEPSAGGNGSSHLPRDDSHHGDEAASAGPATMPFGVDTPELFDMDAEEDDEFIEQLRQVVSGDAPLPDTDAAMAAFFDHDREAGPERPVSAANKSGKAGPERPVSAANKSGKAGPERPVSAANKSGKAGTRSESSGRGGRLGPRA